jgi:hypothetical protein
MVRRLHTFVGLLLLALSSCATAQVRGRTTADCRRLASALTDRVTDSTWHTALSSIYDCPDQLGPTLATLWRTLPTDSIRRRQLYFVSAAVRDASLYRELVSQAADTQSPDSLRYHAIEALVTIADSTRLISVNPLPPAGGSGTTAMPTVAIGGFSHPFVRGGRNPLPVGVRDSILALLRYLSAADSSPGVKYVARKANDWLIYPSQPR